MPTPFLRQSQCPFLSGHQLSFNLSSCYSFFSLHSSSSFHLCHIFVSSFLVPDYTSVEITGDGFDALLWLWELKDVPISRHSQPLAFDGIAELCFELKKWKQQNTFISNSHDGIRAKEGGRIHSLWTTEQWTCPLCPGLILNPGLMLACHLCDHHWQKHKGLHLRDIYTGTLHCQGGLDKAACETLKWSYQSL